MEALTTGSPWLEGRASLCKAQEWQVLRGAGIPGPESSLGSQYSRMLSFLSSLSLSRLVYEMGIIIHLMGLIWTQGDNKYV